MISNHNSYKAFLEYRGEPKISGATADACDLVQINA